ncbi:MAG: protein TolR [Gammaproteobacteria bacterium]|jgi:biopolymer transport protein TolR
MQGSRKRPISEINVVPYIDVMLVLLVIFMITAPLLSQGVKVDLPRVPADVLPPTDQEPLIVTVDAAGQAYLNIGDHPERPVEHSTLIQRVNALLRYRPKTSVLVKGDQAAKYGAVVVVMRVLKEAGAQSVGLMTQPPESRE